MNKNNNTKRTANSILCILLFLACFNFLGRGPIIFFIFSFFAILAYPRHSISGMNYVYFFMSLAAFFASIIFYDYNEYIKSFVFFTSFLAGYSISTMQDGELVKKMVFFAVLGFVAHLIFLTYMNIVVLGHVAGDRTLLNPWTGHLISVTLVGLNSCVPIAYAFYCFFCQEKKWLKVFGAIILVLSIYINSATATRTPFVLLVIVYAIMLYVLFKSGGTKKKTWLFFVVIASIGAFFYFLPSIYNSAIANRFSDEELQTSRMAISEIYFEHMWDYPFGGGFVQKNYNRMAHNVIQESYDLYGVFFFVFFMIAFVGIIKKWFTLYKIKNKSDVSILFMVLVLSILPQVMLEPVIQGYPQLLWFLLLLDGMLMGLLKYRKNDVLRQVV